MPQGMKAIGITKHKKSAVVKIFDMDFCYTDIATDQDIYIDSYNIKWLLLYTDIDNRYIAKKRRDQIAQTFSTDYDIISTQALLELL